jgi:N-acetylglucosamine kinase-like BadF-type ATPase
MKDYIIGVDSGGSSTLADAYDLNGNLLLSADAGYGNLLVNKKIALQNLKKVIEEITLNLGITNCKAIIFGIAGIDSGNYKQTIFDAFEDYSPKKIILNDAWLAHYALLDGKDGCLVISGTGSIAIGRYLGTKKRVGGWGNLLGDNGSGYDIAKKLIISILNAYDENRSMSKLERGLLDFLEFTNPFELVRYVNASSKDLIAKITLFVADNVNKDDEQAINLLEEAGIDLGLQAIMLIEKLNFQEDIHIAVTGSVLLNNELVYQSFTKKVKENFEKISFIRKKVTNTIGAYHYYKRNYLHY